MNILCAFPFAPSPLRLPLCAFPPLREHPHRSLPLTAYLPVEPIKRNGPCSTPIHTYLPQLAHRTIGVGGPGDAVGLELALAVFGGFGLEDHGRPVPLPFQLEIAALVIDPELLPFAGGGVVEIIARARVAPSRRGPVLLHHAIALHEHDAVGPHQFAFWTIHLPLPDPEVELLCLLMTAGAGWRGLVVGAG